MMTKKVSKPAAQYRFLLLLPLMSCFLWCCSQNREHVAIDIKGTYAMRHDIQLTYSPALPADTIIRNNADRNDTVVIWLDQKPMKLNNETILSSKDLSAAPKCINPGQDLNLKYLIKHSGADEILKKMADGEYHMMISDIIINPSGKTEYYSLTFPENWKSLTADPSGLNTLKPSGLTKADDSVIQEKIAQVVIGGPIAFTAAKDKQGKPVPAFVKWEDEEWRNKLETILQVKNHSITYLN